MLPFPLQDSEGRIASILWLYKHVGEQPVAHHNVATRGIMHLHLEMMPCEAMCLGNQVVCMIVPPDQQCLRSVQPHSGTSGGSNNFAASHKGLCIQHHI